AEQINFAAMPAQGSIGPVPAAAVYGGRTLAVNDDQAARAGGRAIRLCDRRGSRQVLPGHIHANRPACTLATVGFEQAALQHVRGCDNDVPPTRSIAANLPWQQHGMTG